MITLKNRIFARLRAKLQAPTLVRKLKNRKKRDFIFIVPTQKLREEHENYGENIPCTNSYVEPIWYGFFFFVLEAKYAVMQVQFSYQHGIQWNSQVLPSTHNCLFYWMIYLVSVLVHLPYFPPSNIRQIGSK